MRYIYFSENYISALTDPFENETHKHLMLQLVVKSEGKMNVRIEDKEFICRGIIVDQNKEHYFDGEDSIHYFMFIEPTSYLANEFQERFIMDKGYYIFNNNQSDILQANLKEFIKKPDTKGHNIFINKMFSMLKIEQNKEVKYDERIHSLLEGLDNYDCCELSLKLLAEDLSISPSRLSHLFKEQIGIPLGSYLVLYKMQCAYLSLADGKNITDRRRTTESSYCKGIG